MARNIEVHRDSVATTALRLDHLAVGTLLLTTLRPRLNIGRRPAGMVLRLHPNTRDEMIIDTTIEARTGVTTRLGLAGSGHLRQVVFHSAVQVALAHRYSKHLEQQHLVKWDIGRRRPVPTKVAGLIAVLAA